VFWPTLGTCLAPVEEEANHGGRERVDNSGDDRFGGETVMGEHEQTDEVPAASDDAGDLRRSRWSPHAVSF